MTVALSGKTVLIVDDEELLREVMRDDLLLLGCRVLEAANGIEAWKVLQRERADLVISDVRMPKGNGLELLRRIQTEMSPPVPLVFISAFADINAAVAEKLGALALLEKPFELEQLRATVRAVLGGTIAGR